MYCIFPLKQCHLNNGTTITHHQCDHLTLLLTRVLWQALLRTLVLLSAVLWAFALLSALAFLWALAYQHGNCLRWPCAGCDTAIISAVVIYTIWALVWFYDTCTIYCECCCCYQQALLWASVLISTHLPWQEADYEKDGIAMPLLLVLFYSENIQFRDCYSTLFWVLVLLEALI